MNYFWLALGLSLAIHIAQYTSLVWYGGHHLKTRQNEKEVIEIELSNVTSPSQDPQDLQVIKAPEIKSAPPPEIKTPASFQSEVTQRVQKQMQAREKGQFQNASRQNVSGQNSATQAARQSSTQNQSIDPTKNKSSDRSREEPMEFESAVTAGTLPRPSNRSVGLAIGSNGPSGASRFEYQLSNQIDIGEITALDTDAHIYASFYNRIVDLFYVRWISQLDQIWNRLSQEKKQSLRNRTWRTDVEVILNNKGVYQTARVLQSSGFTPFDQAAIQAFKNAQVFPNPPQGKIESDGLVRFKLRVGVNVY